MQDGTSIVYVRRRPDDGLDRIIHLAEQRYASGVADFLVIDMSGDAGALAVLGRRGDPVRYLSFAPATPVAPLLRGEHGLAGASRVIVVDDRPLDLGHDAALPGRVDFVARDQFARHTADAG